MSSTPSIGRNHSADDSDERLQETSSDVSDAAQSATSSTPARDRAETAPSVLSSASSPDPATATSTPKEQDSPDDELRRATAMAMAIQNNPKMTTEELHKLIAQQEEEAKEQKQRASSVDGNGRDQVKGQSSGTNSTNKFKGFRFDSKNITASIRAAVTGESATAEASASVDPQPQVQSKEKNNTNTRLFDGHRIKAAFNRQDKTENSEDRPKSPGGHASSGGSTGRRLIMRQNKVRTPPPSPKKTPGEAPSSQGSNGMTATNMLATTSKPITNVATEATRQASTLFQNFQSTILPKAQSPIVRGAPIRLTAIAWKRRGGMGKYSTSGGWERRRIELQGSRILYYAKDEVEQDVVVDGDSERPDGSLPGDNPLGSINSSIPPPPTSSGMNLGSNSSGDDVSEGVVVAKSTTWFENAFVTQEDPNMPRGFLDLAKEKANVHASLGNGGAPSPFAISIKVRGETKWKLCFDHHRTQMEWLAALTDVVVQSSVDLYNAQLLEASDPSNQGDSANTLNLLTATAPAQVKAPPGMPQENAGMRLWQMQAYSVTSGATPYDLSDETEGELEDIEEEDEEEMDLILTEEKHKEAQAIATEESAKTWMIPEDNFLYLAVIFNAAMVVARMSLLSLPGFWYLVVFSNASLYFCLRHEPDWKSVVEYVCASPIDPVDTKTEDTSKVRSSSKSEDLAMSSKSKSNPSYKPVAGTTTIKLKNPTDAPVNSKNEVFGGWRSPSAEGLMVRSHGYLTTKKKFPSPGELYECIACDIFEAPTRYPDMAPRVKLPSVTFEDDDGTPKTWRTPDMFVITIALPTDPPKLGRSSGDGGGYTITLYLAMKQETRDILKRVTAEGYDPSTEDYGDDIQKTKVNAVRLLEEWVRRAPTDQSWFSRFKCVPNAHNLREIGMPGWISKYNGKPFLIKRPGVTGFIHQHPELSVFEFDISLHPFPYLARQGICFLKENFFKKVLVSFGFVIEGRAEDELPECIIGVLQLCYPDPAHGIQAKDFFSGAAPKSFE